MIGGTPPVVRMSEEDYKRLLEETRRKEEAPKHWVDKPFVVEVRTTDSRAYSMIANYALGFRHLDKFTTYSLSTSSLEHRMADEVHRLSGVYAGTPRRLEYLAKTPGKTSILKSSLGDFLETFLPPRGRPTRDPYDVPFDPLVEARLRERVELERVARDMGVPGVRDLLTYDNYISKLVHRLCDPPFLALTHPRRRVWHPSPH